MFKQLSMFNLDAGASLAADALAAALGKARFVPCAPTQALALGWVPPRGDEHGALLEVVDRQWLLALRFEQRLLPASVVREHAERLAQRIEAETGRKPGKRQLRDLKEQASFELLPQAFTKQTRVQLWIDPQARRLAVDSTTQARLDAVLTALVAAAPALAPRAVQTTLAPASAMADWLASGAPPAGFTVDQDCELKAADESRAAVRYSRHTLDPDEVRRHLERGLRPTRLALTWRDRVSLVLTEKLELKRLALLDGTAEALGPVRGEDNFDADLALATGELRRLWPDLLAALDGELQGLTPEPVAA